MVPTSNSTFVFNIFRGREIPVLKSVFRKCSGLDKHKIHSDKMRVVSTVLKGAI